MKVKLSDRVRPNSEVSPWLYDEIVELERKLDESIASDRESIEMYQRCRDSRIAIRVELETAREALAETRKERKRLTNGIAAALDENAAAKILTYRIDELKQELDKASTEIDRLRADLARIQPIADAVVAFMIDTARGGGMIDAYVVRDPSGRVIGMSAVSYRSALDDVWANDDWINEQTKPFPFERLGALCNIASATKVKKWSANKDGFSVKREQVALKAEKDAA